ncbi:MAG: carboxypeptidase regulatory-like domain-containing protein [Pyrinomonadaceae bacterium]
MRKALHLLVLAGIFALSAADGYGQNRNSVTGFVFDESRRPVSQIYVELLNEFYSTVSRARTGGSGMYSFRNLESGLYYVKVLYAGTNFEVQIKSVSLVPISVIQGRGAAAEQVDFYLRSRKQPDRGEPGPPAVIFVQDVPAEAKTLFEEGVRELDTSKDEAFAKIKRAIEIFPEYFAALDRLGLAYLELGHYEAAYVLLAKAVSVNSRSLPTTIGLGVAEFRLGAVKPSLERFRQAVKLDSTSINAQLWLGISLHSTSDLAGALTALMEAAKLSDGKVAEVHWQLARVYKDQKNFSKAADELETFLRLRPDAQNAAEIKKIITSLRTKA